MDISISPPTNSRRLIQHGRVTVMRTNERWKEPAKQGAPPQRYPLGHFENALLRAIEILGPDAYGAQIGRYLSDKLRRDVTAPQVYMTLERLAKRGLVRSENT